MRCWLGYSCPIPFCGKQEELSKRDKLMLYKTRMIAAQRECSDDGLRGIVEMLKNGDGSYLSEMAREMDTKARISAVQILGQKGKGVKAMPIVKQLVPLLFPMVQRKESEMESLQSSVSAVYTAWEFYIGRNFMTPWGHIAAEGTMTIFSTQQDADEEEADKEEAERKVRLQIGRDIQNRLRTAAWVAES